MSPPGSPVVCFHGGQKQMVETIRNIAEIGFGVIYSIGAIFNAF